jgi:hypothetical protein
MTEEPFRPQKAIILSELSTIDNEGYFRFFMMMITPQMVGQVNESTGTDSRT